MINARPSPFCGPLCLQSAYGATVGTEQQQKARLRLLAKFLDAADEGVADIKREKEAAAAAASAAAAVKGKAGAAHEATQVQTSLSDRLREKTAIFFLLKQSFIFSTTRLIGFLTILFVYALSCDGICRIICAHCDAGAAGRVGRLRLAGRARRGRCQPGRFQRQGPGRPHDRRPAEGHAVVERDERDRRVSAQTRVARARRVGSHLQVGVRIHVSDVCMCVYATRNVQPATCDDGADKRADDGK